MIFNLDPRRLVPPRDVWYDELKQVIWLRRIWTWWIARSRHKPDYVSKEWLHERRQRHGDDFDDYR